MKTDLNRQYYESLYEGSADPSSFEVRSKRLSLSRALRGIVLDGATPSIVDVGFGGGELLVLLAERFPAARLAGIESSRNAVRRLNERHPAWDLRTGSAEETPFESEAFDLVLCSHTLEHLRDDRPAAKELKRLIKPNGYLVVGVPGPASGENPLHERLYTTEMIEALFSGLHLRNIHCYGSKAFMTVYWKTRRFAQSAKIVESAQVQSSRVTGSTFARIASAVGVPLLLGLYALDSTTFRSREDPFEVWGVWQKI
ncbi:MAG TPA: class I SAM-dependent methyltransferase [Candidatus Baltobacteraceae bacterium]|nr:class I SAM-dependent methyltransferase [Candidatus Baltobacteraceae bacterium]